MMLDLPLMMGTRLETRRGTDSSTGIVDVTLMKRFVWRRMYVPFSVHLLARMQDLSVDAVLEFSEFGGDMMEARWEV